MILLRESKSSELLLPLFTSNDLPEPERNAILWNPCDPVSMEGRWERTMFTSELLSPTFPHPPTSSIKSEKLGKFLQNCFFCCARPQKL
nr:hypothetical transcript [Hymenolepis microstoma]